MRVGIVGGTGKEGLGLGLRWAQAGHEVIIGSRDPGRAAVKAAELAASAPGSRITGLSNRDAAAAGEIVVLTVPATGLGATLPELREPCRGKVVISTVVGIAAMARGLSLVMSGVAERSHHAGESVPA